MLYPDTVADIVAFCGTVLSIFVSVLVEFDTFEYASVDCAYIVQLLDIINGVV